MVTTFVVDSDLRKSAYMLSKKHVHNQCREALMAIGYLNKINYVCTLLNLPTCPNINNNVIQDFLAKVNWARQIVIQYKAYCKNINYELVFNRNQSTYRWLPSSRKDLLVESENYLFKGYVNHPATLAWVGHVEALMEYCNIHNNVSIERGFQSNIENFIIDKPIIWPWWIKNPIVIASYRNNLLMKELIRGYEPWYTKMTDFIAVKNHAIFSCGNIWLAKLDEQTLYNIHNNNLQQLNLWEICDKPNYGSTSKTVINKVNIIEYPGCDYKMGWYLYYLLINDKFPVQYKLAAFQQLNKIKNRDQNIPMRSIPITI